MLGSKNGRTTIDDRQFKNETELLKAGRQLASSATGFTATELKVILAAAEKLPDKPTEYWHRQLWDCAHRIKAWWLPATTPRPPRPPSPFDPAIEAAQVKRDAALVASQDAHAVMVTAMDKEKNAGRSETFITNEGAVSRREGNAEDRRVAGMIRRDAEIEYGTADQAYTRASGTLNALLFQRSHFHSSAIGLS